MVPIKDPGLIGKKMKCPKCTFPFVVAAPDDVEVAAEEETPAPKAKAKAKSATSAGDAVNKDAKAKAKPKLKSTEPSDDEDSKKPKKKKSKSGGNNTVMIGAIVGGVALVVLAGGYFMFMGGDPKPANNSNSSNNSSNNNSAMPGMNNGTEGPVVDGNTPGTETPVVSNDKDITNLLPNNTQVVISVNMEKLMSFPPSSSLFDPNASVFLKNSLGFGYGDIKKVIMSRSVIDASRTTNFTVIQLRTSLTQAELKNQTRVPNMSCEPGVKRENGREYYEIRSNRFLDSLQEFLEKEMTTIATQSGVNVPTPVKDPTKWSIHVFDPNTVILADSPTMIAWLKAGGQPKFLTELTAPSEGETGSSPMGSPMGMPPIGISPMGMGPMGAPKGPPMGPMGPMGTPMGAGGPKLFTSNPTYRTVHPNLKSMLNSLEENQQPVITFAANLDAISPEITKQLSKQAGVDAPIDLPLVGYGLTLTQLSTAKIAAALVAEFKDSEKPRELEELLKPLVSTFVLPALIDFLQGNVEMKGIAGGFNNGYPGGEGPMGYPMGNGPMRSPPGMISPMSNGPMRSPPGMISPMGSPMSYPMGYPNSGNPNQQNQATKSWISVVASDRTLTISAELDWKDVYRTKIRPVVSNTIAQTKGKALMRSGSSSWWALSGTPKGFDKQTFPQGAHNRNSQQSRFGMPFAPSERVGWMAELLPQLGHQPLSLGLKRDQSWDSEDNLNIGEAWVPEFLNPSYPANAWRAAPPTAKGRLLGGTNFVGISGVGLDAGYYPPEDERNGIFGYDRQTKLADVTDGLENTIYMIQVPPTYSRPWIHGGATIQGVPETKSIQPFLSPQTNGKQGTIVLMADGSVRFVNGNVSDEVFKAMATYRAKDKVTDLDTVAPKMDASSVPKELQATK